MADYDIGYGSSVAVKRAAGGAVFVTLEGVREFSLPTSEVDEIDVTHMGSPNRQREYISGLRDNGEVSLEMLWAPSSATDTLLREILATGEACEIRFTVENGATDFVETYSGFCKGYERNTPYDDVKTATATFRISGVIE